MAKRYTCDGKLLICPELEFNGRIYGVDNRKKTVEALSELKGGGSDLNEIIKLLLGKEAANELDLDNVAFPAVIDLVERATAAATGEDPAKVSARFQEPGPADTGE